MLSWRTARRSSGLSVAAVLVIGMLVPSTAHAAGTEVTGGTPGKAATPKPPAVKVAKTKVPAVASGGVGDVVAELPKTSTSKFRMIGVTWSQDGLAYGVKVEVRTRTNGTWSSWTPLDYDGDSGEGGNPGTDPLWVGKADGVAARVTSKVGAPKDVRIATIDPGSDGEQATASTASDTSLDGVAHASSVVDLGDGNPTYTPKPTIITRSQWGASDGTPCDSPLTGDRTRGVVVHHTAGSNSYDKADSKAIVRATQAYHVKGRGWCDIGYNFLVDKYGQIFEGRRGGVDRPVRAAHSGNATVNTYTMGVSMMGNYDVTRPSAALKAAMVKLVGWRLGTNFIKAKGTYSIGGLTLNRIAGHRNVVSTECPGRYGYAWLSQSGGLRDRVEAYMSKYSSPIKTLYSSLGGSKTGAIYIGEAKTSTGSRLDAKLMDLYAKSGATTARYLSGRNRTEYDRVGSRGGPLGYPKDNPRTVGDAIAQHFDGGSIFAVSGKTKAYSLLGGIAKVYTQLGEATGKLGVPTSSTSTVSTGVTRANFAKGWIISTKSTGKTVAYSSSGSILTTTSTTTSTGDTVTVPSSRTIAVTGHGFGHGIGMSQYGAQGAAIKDKDYRQILGYYYPGTSFGTSAVTMRVLISAATSSTLTVRAGSGLRFRRMPSSVVTLPSSVGGATVSQWRIKPTTSDPSRSAVQYRTDTWHAYTAIKVWAGDAQFERSSWPMTLVLPDGSTRQYRSRLRAALPSAGATTRKTVNLVQIDDYTRGVVAAEMPSSWRAEALKAQAVAARTYGRRAYRTTSYYDICDTTSCQVYRGASGETAATDAAVAGTKGVIVMYDGAPAFTQFSSSSGGASAAGSQPYLKAKPDQFDAVASNPNHDWSTSVSAARIEKAYPTIGTLKKITVTKRNGVGDWGGRVLSVSLVGSTKTITISGASARSAFGLKSAWFRF